MQYDLSDLSVRAELLQRMLRYLSLSRGMDDLLVSVDGVYNEETRRAVMRFQQIEKIPVTGVVDQRTWDAIAELYAREQALRSPVRIRLIPDDRGYVTGMAEQSDAVLILQVMLNALLEKYRYSAVPLTGIYDRATSDAVREFQRIGGLSETGLADRLTWLRLAEEFELLTAGNS